MKTNLLNPKTKTLQNPKPNQTTSEEDKKGIQNPSLVPQLQLPKSGGAIKGIGEKFTANPATGTGNFSLPIGLTAGRGAPQLNLSYSSGAGNSPFGLGWQIDTPRISRKTERQLPQYNDVQDSDIFILSGAEDLVKKLHFDGTDWQVEEYIDPIDSDLSITRYRPRTEGLFARIEQVKNTTSGDVYWRSISGENITSIYGETPESRITDPNDSSRVFNWLLCKTFDNKGNITLFEYKQEDNANVPNDLSESRRKNNTQAQQYLKRIKYGNEQPYKVEEDILNEPEDFLFQVVFDYGEHDADYPRIEEDQTWPCRKDAFSTYRSGFEIRSRRLCRRILMFHDFPAEFGLGAEPCLIQSTDFQYDENPTLTQLINITSVAYEKENGLYIKNDMPPLEFAYSKAVLDDTPREIAEPYQRNVPQGLSANYQFTDLNAEGLSGVLIETAAAWYYKRNLGNGQFDALKTVSEKPNWSNLSGGTQLSNLEANGQLYLSQFGQNGGYAKRADDGTWSPFRNFTQQANIDLSDPDIRYVDLNGDGKPEILLLRDQVLRWYPNAGEAGYEAEKRSYTGTDSTQGPARIFQNDLENIFLSDMTGDGLSDIVRIRNGDICYWPNLGYGRFGEKVIMDDAPIFAAPNVFQSGNIRLSDIDGSGTTDILYLAGHKTQFWLNQSGNRFAAPTEIKSFPKTHKQSTVSVFDLLGNGTSCLVWSSPLGADAQQPWRYVDLMSSTKPYLLTEIRNNMGSVTRTHYKASTYFYLKDERAGKPWVTKLPFPVHVVHQTEVEDLITGHRFVTEYAYHHGYYDRAEREFRGFGFVEQWDDEAFKDPKPDSPTNEFEKPRIKTCSWFHTGAWEKEHLISSQYEHEYWQPSPDVSNDWRLPESELLDSDDWSALEIREAKRALRGQLLRQEVFTEDGVPESDKPYLVTESRYQVQQIQPISAETPHAVYIAVPLESLSAHYERNEKDPRLAHEMTLEIDDFGNVLKTAAVAYPRQFRPDNLSDKIPEQFELKIICTENKVFNQSDRFSTWYVKGVPIAAVSYEVTNHPLFAPPLFQRQQVLDMLDNLSNADRKVLSAQVNYYRANDEADNLSPANLDFREIESYVLPSDSYTLVFTDDILQAAYGGKLSQAEWEAHLLKEKYEKDPHAALNNLNDWWASHAALKAWWVTGGAVAYEPEKFFTITKARDAWGNPSEIRFDNIGLLPVWIKDPLKNIIEATYDYRILQPLEIVDPNGNRQRAAYDGFGRVIRTAVMGKVDENKGDELSGNPRAAFNENDSDTAIIEYHHDEFYNSNGTRPNYVHTHTRETHFHDLTQGEPSRWMQARVYSDGFGRELQSKARIADGKAYFVESGQLDSQDDGDRWLGSGRTIYDNKGQPVKQFEPYFSTTFEYENEDELVQWGVSPFIHYDALGRVVRTDMPDGTFTEVEFTPWIQKTYDAHDTVEDSEWYKKRTDSSRPDYINDAKEHRAARLSFLHKNLPAIAFLDSLGRPVVTQQDIKTTTKGTGKTIVQIDTHTIPETLISKVVLDTAGNPLKTIDANKNTALEAVFDLVGRPLKSESNDAGTSYILYSIDNQPVCSWLPRGHTISMEYDKFRRPIQVWADEGQGKQLKEAMVYGEDFSHPDFPNPESQNMRGQVWKSFDSGGVAEVTSYDFKGAPLESKRLMFKNQQETWTEAKVQQYTPSGSETGSIFSDTFETSINYDALGRPIKNIAPDGSSTENFYDEGGLLQKVIVTLPNGSPSEKVKNIDYNEKGQRLKIEYGNGVATKYEYDPLSYRLVNLNTKANSALQSKTIQDLYYTYDAVGNIVKIEDKAQTDTFFKNQKISATQEFEYDSLNRLIHATGREHIGQTSNGEQIKIPSAETGNNAAPYYDHAAGPNDTKALRNYTQCYAYDAVGNILRWKHIAVGGSYTRDYIYDYQLPSEPENNLWGNSNRLVKTVRGDKINDNDDIYDYKNTKYDYDEAGNILQLDNHENPIKWNFENQPTFMDFGQSKQAHYTYDASGERLRKVIHKSADEKDERIYLGNFEIYRNWKGNTLQKERTTLHIADDSGRICMIETMTVNTSTNPPAHEQVGAKTVRYQLSNHLGSVGMELNETGDIISFEEYHPYGTTAFYWKNTTISQKRYRYTGKERDEESGLSYHSARYYLPWLGRWLSADPAGMVDGTNLYIYCSDKPINKVDDNGKWDIEVHVYSDRKKYGYGIAILKDINGKEVFRFKIRAEGTAGTDRLKTNANTPLGIYEIPDKNMWLSGGSRKSYGPNHRLAFEGESGEIKKSGRSAIRIHGGRQEEYSNVSKSWTKIKAPKLKKTNGCLRAFDDDVKNLKKKTDELQKNNSKEVGGKLTVIDDLVEKKGSYVLPGTKQVQNKTNTEASSQLSSKRSWSQSESVALYVPRKPKEYLEKIILDNGDDFEVIFPFPGEAIVNTSGGKLNVRATPNGEKLTNQHDEKVQLDNNEKITFTGAFKQGFCEIYSEDSESCTGWVSVDYVVQNPQVRANYMKSKGL